MGSADPSPGAYIPGASGPAGTGHGRATDDYIRRGRKIVRQHGWMVQGVLPDAQQASYSYTVGLSKGSGHPKSSWWVSILSSLANS